MTGNQEILIWSELKDGGLTSATKEILELGRGLKEILGQDLSLLLVGIDFQEPAHAAIALGADRVYTIAGTGLIESHPEHITALIASYCSQFEPSMILLAHTDVSRDMAPRLAAKLEASVCMDCTELSIDPVAKIITMNKPVYGGNAIAVWELKPDSCAIVTLRPGIATPAAPDTNRQGQIVPFSPKLEDFPFSGTLLETVKEESEGIRLEDAKIIVAGGGGIGGREGFHLIEELAEALGAAVGITRVPSDEGWMPANQEIGQTGHMVSPDIYIAVGISGAPQHLTGCSGAKTIIAINKDPEAHIFKEADYGIVGDFREVLPALTEKLKSLLSS